MEIVGEIAKTVELGIENNAKQATLDETMTRSVRVVAGTGFVQDVLSGRCENPSKVGCGDSQPFIPNTISL